MASPRLAGAESKQRTRARLLAAASSVFRERGYRRASVEEVASEAGYTVGALYSNFTGKDDLLLALLEQEIGAIVERIRGAIGEEEGAIEKLRRGSLEWIAILD